jgi:hypothetical protein
MSWLRSVGVDDQRRVADRPRRSARRLLGVGLGHPTLIYPAIPYITPRGARRSRRRWRTRPTPRPTRSCRTSSTPSRSSTVRRPAQCMIPSPWPRIALTVTVTKPARCSAAIMTVTKPAHGVPSRSDRDGARAARRLHRLPRAAALLRPAPAAADAAGWAAQAGGSSWTAACRPACWCPSCCTSRASTRPSRRVRRSCFFPQTPRFPRSVGRCWRCSDGRVAALSPGSPCAQTAGAGARRVGACHPDSGRRHACAPATHASALPRRSRGRLRLG